MPLLNRNPRGRQPDTPAARRPAETTDELPPYESPSCPLNETSKRGLADLAHHREAQQHNSHLNRSTNFLKDSVASINDRASTRREQGRRLQVSSSANDLEKVTAREASDELSEAVRSLTERTEAAFRNVIDRQAALQDEKVVLTGLGDRVSEAQGTAEDGAAHNTPRARRHTRRGVVADGEEHEEAEGDEANTDADAGEDDPSESHLAPPTSTVPGLLARAQAAKADEYVKLSVYEKYGKNNAYITFKRTLHDAFYHDDEVPLPDASTWFSSDGKPRLPKPIDTADGGMPAEGSDDEMDGDEEEDLVVAREVRSLRCPLTLTTMKDPVTSEVCGHSFEKSAIETTIKSNGGKLACPVHGCKVKDLTIKKLKPDEVLLRQIKRHEAREARQEAASDEEDEEDEEGDAIDVDDLPEPNRRSIHRSIKHERQSHGPLGAEAG